MNTYTRNLSFESYEFGWSGSAILLCNTYKVCCMQIPAIQQF